jgi:hypothetical protein
LKGRPKQQELSATSSSIHSYIKLAILQPIILTSFGTQKYYQ